MVAGCVLAGGRSQRMGCDKALLAVGGTPLARRAALTLAAGGCAPVHLIGNQPALATLGFPVLREPSELGRHPLLGVAAALQVADGLTLFSPCDLPNLTAATVRALLGCGGPCAAAGQPLLCVLPPGLADQALELLRRGGPASALVCGLPQVSVPARELHNANAPVDLQGY